MRRQDCGEEAQAAELQEAQGQVDEMDGHRREEGAGADVKPGEGDDEEPERDERSGIDVDERKED